MQSKHVKFKIHRYLIKVIEIQLYRSQIYDSASLTLPDLKKKSRPSAMLQSGKSVMKNYS